MYNVHYTINNLIYIYLMYIIHIYILFYKHFYMCCIYRGGEGLEQV